MRVGNIANCGELAPRKKRSIPAGVPLCRRRDTFQHPHSTGFALSWLKAASHLNAARNDSSTRLKVILPYEALYCSTATFSIGRGLPESFRFDTDRFSVVFGRCASAEADGRSGDASQSGVRCSQRCGGVFSTANGMCEMPFGWWDIAVNTGAGSCHIGERDNRRNNRRICLDAIESDSQGF